MSFGSSGKRHSGGKGFSGAKKARRKRQEFHEHKLRPSDRAGPDLEELRGRVIIALGKLGHQRLSAEPGGYDLKSWMRNFNLLLDEFDDKVGKANLPADYLAKRPELTAALTKPVDTSSVAAEIGRLTLDEAELGKRMDDEERRLNARLEGLRTDQARLTSEIEEGRRRQRAEADQHKASSPRPFLSRLLGRAPPTSPTDSTEATLAELGARLESLRSENAELQRIRTLLGERTASGSPYAEDWQKLESLRARIQNLESIRLDMLQLTREREEVTGTLAAIISQLPLVRSEGGPATAGENPGPLSYPGEPPAVGGQAGKG